MHIEFDHIVLDSLTKWLHSYLNPALLTLIALTGTAVCIGEGGVYIPGLGDGGRPG